jgi:Transposase DDE domain group 1
MFSRINRTQFGKALPVQVSHRFSVDSAVFDDGNLVSCAGLVPVMALAERTGLSDLLAQMVHIAAPRIKSGSANPGPKLATLIAGMCVGADCIDDIDVLRSGGMKTLFDAVYAPSTIGTLLREFTFGHARQLESVLAGHLARLCERVDLLAGSDVRAFVDIDSLLRPVYGHAKQGASYGHTKIAGKQVLRKGLSPLATTISTDLAAPVIAGMRLRAGKSNSGKGAGRMVAQAIATARAAGITGQILVRGDSAYGTRTVIGAARRAGAQFSLVLTKNAAVQKAIDAIAEDRWTPVRYPGAVQDPDTGMWISDAEVAEISYTRLRLHQRRHHRAADRAPSQRRPSPRRIVPGVAPSPVLHQLRRATHRRRHHPPAPRHHRNHLRRPDRRPAGAHALRALRRQLGLGAVRRHRPQSAARRRNAGRPRTRRRARSHSAPQDRQHRCPPDPPSTKTRPALTHPLALG